MSTSQPLSSHSQSQPTTTTPKSEETTDPSQALTTTGGGELTSDLPDPPPPPLLSSATTNLVQRIKTRPRPLAPAEVLTLQRLVGNQAVMRALAAQSPKPRPEATASNATIQREFVETVERDGLRYGRWEEQDADEVMREPGWYELNPQNSQPKGDKLEDEDVKKLSLYNLVWIKVWQIRVNYKNGARVEAAEVPLDGIMGKVKQIWKVSDVNIENGGSQWANINFDKLPEEYNNLKSSEFNDDMNKVMQPLINGFIQNRPKQLPPVIHLVLVPTYERWGLTYRPGTGGVKGNEETEKGYDGPVTFVATSRGTIGQDYANGEQQRIKPEDANNAVENEDEDENQDENEDEEYIPIDIALDAAHEIGHALGLEHHKEVKENVPLLMHPKLYHEIGNAARLQQDNAQELAKKKGQGYDNSHLYKKPANHQIKNWAILHGSELSEQDKQKVLQGIQSGDIYKRPNN